MDKYADLKSRLVYATKDPVTGDTMHKGALAHIHVEDVQEALAAIEALQPQAILNMGQVMAECGCTRETACAILGRCLMEGNQSNA